MGVSAPRGRCPPIQTPKTPAGLSTATATASSWAKGPASSSLKICEHAVRRGAKIYAELAGYGNTADAYHFTAPEPSGDGMVRVMKAALKDAAIEPGEIGYINAHGTSTALNDKIESAAIMKVFGAHARALKVSSIKSMIGHLLAAAGAVEFIATVMSVHTGIVPPTIHYREPDPDCPLDYVTRGAESTGAAICRQQFVRLRRRQRLSGRQEIRRMNMTIPKLKIGSITAEIPIIQGGMGVRVSLSSLASAVANEGGIGTLSSIGLGDFVDSLSEYEADLP